MNRNSKLTMLVPVVLLVLLFFNVKAGANDLNTSTTQSVKTIRATKTTVSTTAKSSVVTTAATGRNVSSTNRTMLSTTHTNFPSPARFGPMLKRLFIVTAVLSLIVGLYFVMKFCRSGRRKTRKYGVVKTPGDAELRPLESDDDDDEEDDVTMFNRKN